MQLSASVHLKYTLSNTAVIVLGDLIQYAMQCGKRLRLADSRIHLQVHTVMTDIIIEMRKLIKAQGDSKSDFYLPPLLEKVCNIWADHCSKNHQLQIRATILATQYRQSLDEAAVVARTMQRRLRLSYMVQQAKSHLVNFMHGLLKAADKAQATAQMRPPAPPAPFAPPPSHRYMPAPYYPQQRMRYGRAVGQAPSQASGPQPCRDFAKGPGNCQFGNSCKYVHEPHLPPPAQRPPQPAEQK